MTPSEGRSATAADAPALAALIRETWPEEQAGLPQIRCALARPQGVTLVVGHDALLGFASAFTTTSVAGEMRWELDLMAVAPAVRGQGIATRLIAALLDEGVARGAALARGLIADSNEASQRTVARFGFAPVGPALTPYTAQAAIPTVQGQSARLLPIETLTYAGLWVEPPFDAAMLEAARHHQDAPGRVLGALIPCEERALCEAADAIGYRAIADGRPYRWWQRALE